MTTAADPEVEEEEEQWVGTLQRHEEAWEANVSSQLHDVTEPAEAFD